MKHFVLLLWIVLFSLYSFVEGVNYPFAKEPIDVVIPAIKKDLATLNFCIRGIRSHCKRVRRIIVVSDKKYTKHAEWYNEKKYPFSKADIALYLNRGNTDLAKGYLEEPHSRVGWYYQQLLKLYAPFVIPGISSNVLVVDADTIFLRSVEFMDEAGAGLYNPGSENFEFYFGHMERLLPGYQKLFPNYSGISHHMLFQKPVLDDLFQVVEETHQIPFWKAFCQQVDPQYLRTSGASEYEIYFNFVFHRSSQVKVRELRWTNAPPLGQLGIEGLISYLKQGFHYVSCHKYDQPNH